MGGSPEDRIRALCIWRGAPTIEPIAGGITNRNYLVRDGARRCVVRLGEDIPVHQISRANELAASIAAHAAGLSPAVLHHAPGVLVLDYVDGRPLTPEDVGAHRTLERILPLIHVCHRDIPKHFRGAAMIFWVFHVIRDYAASLKDGCSTHMHRVGGLLDKAAVLERAAGPFEIAFGHNDLLAANFLDDGRRLWLIDWDYAGFNTPLFDLGGLASNNELSAKQEDWLLEAYFDTAVTEDLRRRYRAMKCASLLRETMWSMVSEIHSTIDFDYGAYTAENLARFNRAFDTFAQS
ncbi:phosphotransferase family protein [Rhizobiaceae bacterium n13]|uniref:Phosphotransferase family protein n=1 Tax=Ferirhizobium litorale TaxID=2927786 RepID=A0AAE3QBV8_9HYPH|nr:phosphotransferase [Fererhizobium litorale]MDI7860617.1 phosphotransferase family protein [Fererhizobium litorale]MDI7920765.1 phosphotransferase family protein [Fererhizobium litorale]